MPHAHDDAMVRMRNARRPSCEKAPVGSNKLCLQHLPFLVGSEPNPRQPTPNHILPSECDAMRALPDKQLSAHQSLSLVDEEELDVELDSPDDDVELALDELELDEPEIGEPEAWSSTSAAGRLALDDALAANLRWRCVYSLGVKQTPFADTTSASIGRAITAAHLALCSALLPDLRPSHDHWRNLASMAASWPTVTAFVIVHRPVCMRQKTCHLALRAGEALART